MFDLRRRKFIALLGGATVAWPLAARAQQAERMRRVGILMPTTEDDSEGRARVAAFFDPYRSQARSTSRSAPCWPNQLTPLPRRFRG